MDKLYVVDCERRNAPDCISDNSENESTVKRKYKSISVDKIQLLLDTKIKEQENLWEQVNARDLRKDNMYKIAFGTFSLFLSGLIAVLTLTNSTNATDLAKEYISLIGLVLLGMTLMNFSIIMNVISLKRSSMMFMRQINSLRHAIYACQYAIIEGRFPSDTETLIDQSTYYFKAIGNYRRLPITNNHHREHHEKFFESSDNISISVITALSVCIGFIPLIFYWNTENTNMAGAVSVIFALVYIGGVLYIRKKVKCATEDALNFDPHCERERE